MPGSRAFDELNAFSALLQSDPELAWSWHCQFAMMAYDAGADPIKANLGAASLMHQAFGVDIKKNPVWPSLEIND
jgi:hypothetical protein